MTAIATVADLKRFLARIPDETPVRLKDPNFGGPYGIEPVEFKHEGWWGSGDEAQVMIEIPIVEPYED